jgi:hypothetical protein
MQAFRHRAASLSFEDYDYVQIVPLASWTRYSSGNDGAQGWRHKQTGWTIPDFCRQSQGYPEMWFKGKWPKLAIAENSPVLACLIVH